MSHYSAQKLVVIEKLITALTEDTDTAITFLVEGLHFDQDEIDEMGCLDIFDKVREEVLDEHMDTETLINALCFVDVEGFDKNSLNFTEKPKIPVDGDIRQPCKNPCPTCPYTKKALSGDFGGNDPEEYANAIHQDTVIACHSRTKHDQTTLLPKSTSDVTICTGHIVAQIKVCKQSRHPDGLKAQETVRNNSNFEELKENALGFDFKSHHGLT